MRGVGFSSFTLTLIPPHYPKGHRQGGGDRESEWFHRMFTVFLWTLTCLLSIIYNSCKAFYLSQGNIPFPFFYQALLIQKTSLPCGNAMIDAPVENLMDSKADHRFTTSAWKSLRLSHNYLDKCKAFIHITTRPITINLIC